MGDGIEVLVVRHGPAEDRDAAARAGVADDDRALTDDGVRKMRSAASGLRELVPGASAVLHSPLRRARETADILSAVWGLRATPCSALAPGGDGGAVYEAAAVDTSGGPVVVVGHEPDLSIWIGEAIGVPAGGHVEMKKGAACLLRFPERPARGRASLLWLVPARALRRMAAQGASG